jgi:hypothetical protein
VFGKHYSTVPEQGVFWETFLEFTTSLKVESLFKMPEKSPIMNFFSNGRLSMDCNICSDKKFGKQVSFTFFIAVKRLASKKFFNHFLQF